MPTEKPGRSRPDLMLYAKLAQYAPGYVCGQLELTSRCLQRCPMCASWRDSEPQGEMPMRTIVDLFHELNQLRTFEHLSLTGGDPQCYPFLEAVAKHPRKFQLQLTTAMMAMPKPWYEHFDRIRVSFDAVDPLMHKAMRGVYRAFPTTALEYLEGIDTEVSTLTTVNEHNIDAVPQILEFLTDYSFRNNRFRRAIFLLEIRDDLPQDVIDTFQEYTLQSRMWNLNTSFGESPIHAALMRNSALTRDCRCYVGDVSFHIKCNGDVYPCCLIGGEAIPTVTEMKIGNIGKEEIEGMFGLQWTHTHRPANYYKNQPECRKVCQWKQVTFNTMVKEAIDVRLAMP